jgi:hypothetical protein
MNIEIKGLLGPLFIHEHVWSGNKRLILTGSHKHIIDLKDKDIERLKDNKTLVKLTSWSLFNLHFHVVFINRY